MENLSAHRSLYIVDFPDYKDCVIETQRFIDTQKAVEVTRTRHDY